MIAQRQRTGDKTSVQFLSAEGRQFPVVQTLAGDESGG